MKDSACKRVNSLEDGAHCHLLALVSRAEMPRIPGMKTNNRDGFTLLEMMIVVTIVSLLSLGTWRGWLRWQQQQELNDTARQIQRLLVRLRSDANWHNAVHLLWLKPGVRWCLGAGADRCSGMTTHTLLAPYPDVSVRRLTQGLGFYGKKNTAHPGSILIASVAGERRIIVSSRGRVRICPPSEEHCR